LEPESLSDTVPAEERDDRLSTHIARARERARRAREARTRSEIRWRVAGTWVSIEDPWAAPRKPASRPADRDA
jgi:hypothetical protein